MTLASYLAAPLPVTKLLEGFEPPASLYFKGTLTSLRCSPTIHDWLELLFKAHWRMAFATRQSSELQQRLILHPLLRAEPTFRIASLPFDQFSSIHSGT